jgi:hypothetical protein
MLRLFVPITGAVDSWPKAALPKMTLSTSGGEKSYNLRPESRMFKDIAVGSEVTIEVNDTGEVIDIHKDKK